MGYAGPAAELLDRAEQLARELGREREAADLLFSRWAARQQTIDLDRSGPLARRLLERGEASSDPVVRAYGLYSWGIYLWNLGDIGEAFRHLSRLRQTRLDDLERREDNPLRHDLQLLGAGMLAETTAMHGDIDGARAMLDAIEAAAGDDPYVNMVWATFAARIATIIGDAGWALHAAERGSAMPRVSSFSPCPAAAGPWRPRRRRPGRRRAGQGAVRRARGSPIRPARRGTAGRAGKPAGFLPESDHVEEPAAFADAVTKLFERPTARLLTKE